MIVESELLILVYWMLQRDRIRAAHKACNPKPWTSDPLLRDYRWCNVRRMDDRVSVAMMRDWYRHDADRPTALAAAILGRLVNWPDSLMAITAGAKFHLADLEHAKARLEQRAVAGLKVFTGAYIVPGAPGESKIATVHSHAAVISDYAFRIFTETMRGTWANLVKWDGLGSFLAGQIVADLVHLQVGSKWEDPMVWAPLGPGSARGMNRLHGRPKDKLVTQQQFEQELPALMEILRPRVADLWADRRLHAMDIQNCLCEFDKYRRLMLREGTVRARYDGGIPGQRSMFA